ncbi:hypothetical protein HF394_02885 [Planococcus glaciei]|uniref:Uncharacterized protein n=1 Tax=Planococcus glaciei TaxID=459472 RepID=A0A7H8Q6M2_9BACL|nr:hypothetical protein HF394_02885 [Planococcus glaciei]
MDQIDLVHIFATKLAQRCRSIRSLMNFRSGIFAAQEGQLKAEELAVGVWTKKSASARRIWVLELNTSYKT